MRTDIDFESDSRLPIQRLDVYAVAKTFAKAVHQAHIRDAELRDQATRAAKSAFLNLCEGLPNRSPAMRRKYFNTARNSLSEAIGALDLAASIGATAPEHLACIQALALRLHRLLSALLR